MNELVPGTTFPDPWRAWNIVFLGLLCVGFMFRTVRDLQKRPDIEWEQVAFRFTVVAMFGVSAISTGLLIGAGTQVFVTVKVMTFLYAIGVLLIWRPWKWSAAYKSIRYGFIAKRRAADRGEPNSMAPPFPARRATDRRSRAQVTDDALLDERAAAKRRDVRQPPPSD